MRNSATPYLIGFRYLHCIKNITGRFPEIATPKSKGAHGFAERTNVRIFFFFALSQIFIVEAATRARDKNEMKLNRMLQLVLSVFHLCMHRALQ